MPVIIQSMNEIADRCGRMAGSQSQRLRRIVRRRMQAVLVATLASVSVVSLVDAVEHVSFEIERVDGAGWSAEGLNLQLELPQRAAATVTVTRLKLDAQQQELRNVRIECRALEISASLLACGQARIVAKESPLGPQVLSGAVRYDRASGEVEIDLNGLRVGAGQVAIAAGLQESGWRARLQLNAVEFEPLMKVAQQWQLPVPDLAASGAVTATLTASGSQSSIHRAHIDAKIDGLTANNADGTLATDKLRFALQADLVHSNGDWKFEGAVSSDQGQAYVQPIFLDLGAHALDVRAKGTWRSDGVIAVDHFSVDHFDVARGDGRATVNPDDEQPLRSLQLNLRTLQFPGAYASYFQPLLLDTNFKSLQTSGAISGQLNIEEGLPRKIDLAFERVTLDDGSRNFVLNGLNGNWHWLDATSDADVEDDDSSHPAAALNSALHWESGTLLNLDLGAAGLSFNTQGRQLRLLQATRIPLMDGAINLESFRIRNAGQPNVAFIVDAMIEPISVRQLCQAFGWPEFGGRIAGKISKLRMREGVITLGTTLQAQVFDGEVRISDLRLEQPFSPWPRFQASIALDNLDLNLVTNAFSFGGITGRLSGAINQLQLFNWTPVAFDARLYTPADDRSRHRISQRAVQNIGSIGGGGAGVTAALSGGVMRFFDDFNYDRLGISCRLENEVCYLEGIAPAPNGGYYLVKGTGLPRIDVIGGARRVDWPRLVQQLIAITESEGPVVN